MWLPEQSPNLFLLELVRNLLTIFLQFIGRNFTTRCLRYRHPPCLFWLLYQTAVNFTHLPYDLASKVTKYVCTWYFSSLLEIALELRQRTLDRTSEEKKERSYVERNWRSCGARTWGLTRIASAEPNVPSLHIVDSRLVKTCYYNIWLASMIDRCMWLSGAFLWSTWLYNVVGFLVSYNTNTFQKHEGKSRSPPMKAEIRSRRCIEWLLATIQINDPPEE